MPVTSNALGTIPGAGFAQPLAMHSGQQFPPMNGGSGGMIPGSNQPAPPGFAQPLATQGNLPTGVMGTNPGGPMMTPMSFPPIGDQFGGQTFPQPQFLGLPQQAGQSGGIQATPGSPFPGGMGIQNALGGLQGMQDGRHQARMDWRAARPDQPQDPMDPAARDAWHQSMMDWRNLRPDRGNGFTYTAAGAGAMPGMPPVMTPGGGGTGAPIMATPGAPNTMFPLNPAATSGMVGSSMGVIGTNPAATSYQFPTYGG